MTKKSVVIDYGIGNVFSVMQALKRNDCDARLTNDSQEILNADRVILPGVGAFGRAAEKLRTMGLDDVIHSYIEQERPFMGICVGMQLLMEKGMEFGEHAGLGLFKGTVEKIDAKDSSGAALPVPVIGWNSLEKPSDARWNNTALSGVPDDAAFYFVHSYSARPSDTKDICATAPVGDTDVVAAIQRDNILGVQFHPERSADHGIGMISTFLNS
ncbi:MAG: imidazole glycerol phosphate synthase subunit HisH [Pelagimonas sp.]